MASTGVFMALLVLFCLFFTVQHVAVHAQYPACPTVYGCRCGFNMYRGKPGMGVVCDRGGLTTIPVAEIPGDTRYLLITAPPSNPNHFALQPRMFGTFGQLEELHLTNSDALRAIADDQFDELRGTLSVLNLTNNAIEYLGDFAFRKLEVLRQLYLDNNRINSLGAGKFVFQTNLHVLSVRNNDIVELNPTFGPGLTQLESLDLSGNPLGMSKNEDFRGTVPASAFNVTHQLRVLRLHNTSLERLPYAELAGHLRKLEVLDVGGSRFCQIDNNQFNKFHALRELDLHGMARQCPQLSMAPRALDGMPELKRLDLGGNNLEDLSGLLAGASRLESLSLAGNNLQQLQPEDFSEISATLTGLDLSQNERLALRPRMLYFLPQLVWLDLSRMNLDDSILPNDLFNYENRISRLNLSTNRLANIDPQLIYTIPSLKSLDVSYNLLERVPVALGGNSRPQNNNNMPRSNIEELYLNDNRLREFPPSQLAGLRSTAATPIRVLRLHNNPWICNCGVFDLYNWITTREGQDVICGAGYNSIPRQQTCPVCNEPAERRGRPMNELDSADFTECRPPRPDNLGPLPAQNNNNNSLLFILLAVAGAIILLLLLLALFAFWRRNRMHTYKTHEEDRKDYEASLYRDSEDAVAYGGPIGVNSSLQKPMLAQPQQQQQQQQPPLSSSPIDANPSSSLSSSSVASQSNNANNHTPKTTSTTSAVNTPLFINNRYQPNGRPPTDESDM